MQEPTRSGSVDESGNLPDFAPDDPTDGRRLGDWRSRYPTDAKRRIRNEAIYLAVHLYAIVILILILWLDIPKNLFALPDQKYAAVLKYGLAWLSGILGGTLFALKWLYHSVARQVWHVDRRLWRFFTPHISGGLAFAVIALISSSVFRIFDQRAVDSHSLVVGVAFMVGYFSDSAIAKLSEIAETLFGATRGREKHKEEAPSDYKKLTEEKSTTDPAECIAGEISLTEAGISGAEGKKPISS